MPLINGHLSGGGHLTAAEASCVTTVNKRHFMMM